MFNFKFEIEKRVGLLGLSISDEIIGKLDEFFVILREESSQYNLIGPMDEMKIVKYLFIDSMAFLKSFSLKPGDRLLDIGSGAGFPGIVLKIMNPEIEMTFLDSSGKKINFLKMVCEKLSLDKVDFMYVRAEDAGKEPGNREKFDYVIARALASVSVALELCSPFLKKGGKVVLWKGKKASEEIAELKNGHKLLGFSDLQVIEFRQEEEEQETNFIFTEKIKKTPRNFPRTMSAIKKKNLGDINLRELSR